MYTFVALINMFFVLEVLGFPSTSLDDAAMSDGFPFRMQVAL